jgi:hypothetical protein
MGHLVCMPVDVIARGSQNVGGVLAQAIRHDVVVGAMREQEGGLVVCGTRFGRQALVERKIPGQCHDTGEWGLVSQPREQRHRRSL